MRISGWIVLLLAGVVNIKAQTESFAKCIEDCLLIGGNDDCVIKKCHEAFDIDTFESYENPLSDSSSDYVPIKRYGNFLRIGRGRNSFVRIGKAAPGDIAEKRQSTFLRIGKSIDEDNLVDKRKHAFVRIGKSAEPNSFEESVMNAPEEDEKRSNSFLRIGRGSSFLRIGRGSSFLRIGKKSAPEENLSKRYGAFLRIGKAPRSSFLRIGKKPNTHNSFLRIGRPGKSAFLRIGKRETLGDSNTSNDKANSLEEATLNFVKDIPDDITQE